MCLAYRVGPRAFDDCTPIEWDALVEAAKQSGRVR
jgi:hypothetical protein